ncbi:MogA/MoaB family molybdenum cofactor biosynthesis protein [Mobilicoccus pelagius]|uniref:Molybdopterin biosynthesis protein n=1 Tax=Mobilicoccus pelagius NBRC 104925 TaxID=1089455 RepID=H5USJ3_9MICO|nr:MogA/MoaB family molybdenum cofactor biosynthesis protein [Mobilicoccus pelagius]GAB48701.1 molybdopterin biosynthesis protein [Mobilicoccus pelagius NBRC 104925]
MTDAIAPGDPAAPAATPAAAPDHPAASVDHSEPASDPTVVGPEDGARAPRRALVVTASTRAAAGIYTDRSGAIVVERLRAWGFDTPDAVVVPDGVATAAALHIALAAAPDVLLTTGGTGLRPDDRTPEVTRPLLDVEVPGIAEAIRAAGVAKGVPTAMLSRGIAGVAGGTLLVNLPGSTGGVKDALDLLEAVVLHSVDQMRGGDH